jgi:hypothetical protein
MIEKYPPTGIEIAPMPDPLDSVVAEFLGIQNEKLAAHTERERLMRVRRRTVYGNHITKRMLHLARNCTIQLHPFWAR